MNILFCATNAAFLPSPDALPLPAPVIVLEVLLQLTFLLHLLAMNALVGGLMLTLYSRLRSRSAGDSWYQLADSLAKVTPMLVAATVTLGVAPLLFLQTLMGPFFFTSSILMGWGWFSVVVVLVFAYYGTYLQSFLGFRLGRTRTPLLAITLLLFLWVGFMFSNNTSLMAAISGWADKYFADPRGLHLNFGDATLAPRYLHAMIGAPAVAGLMVAHWGRSRMARGDDRGIEMERVGLGAFTILTAINILAGLWYVAALPRPAMKIFMGGSPTATALLTVGILGAVGMVLVGIKGLGKESRGNLVWPTALTVIVMAVMVTTRDLARKALLGGNYRPAEYAVQPQILNMVLFVVLLAAGLAILVWMIRALQRSWGN